MHPPRLPYATHTHTNAGTHTHTCTGPYTLALQSPGPLFILFSGPVQESVSSSGSPTWLHIQITCRHQYFKTSQVISPLKLSVRTTVLGNGAHIFTNGGWLPWPPLLIALPPIRALSVVDARALPILVCTQITWRCCSHADLDLAGLGGVEFLPLF